MTATAMLCHLAENIGRAAKCNHVTPSNLTLSIFERQAAFGPGFPHSDRVIMPYHVTNMCAMDMGILPSDPEDFQKWARRNYRSLVKQFPDLSPYFSSPEIDGKPCRHYPRAIMGEYLKARFRDGVEAARKMGMRVDLYPECEVIDLKELHDTIQISVKRLASGSVFIRNAHRVLLATGHWFDSSWQGGYCPSPWPAQNLTRRIPKDQHVAVIGSSLSAIEVVLTLTSEGRYERLDNGRLVYLPPPHPRHVTLYSRRGLLPRVRGKIGNRQNLYFTQKGLEDMREGRNGRLDLENLFRLLDRELAAAYGKKVDWHDLATSSGNGEAFLQNAISVARHGDNPDGEVIWQTVLYRILPMAREIFLNLTTADRKRFEREYSTLFFSHAATQPVINAEKLLALMKARLVKVQPLGRSYRLLKDDIKDRYWFIYRDSNGKEKRKPYRFVVNARGQEKSYQFNRSELAQNLIGSGTVQLEETHDPSEPFLLKGNSGSVEPPLPYRTGSIWVDPKTHQIMKKTPEGRIDRSKGIYAVGAMTRGQFIDASMAMGSVRSTAVIAKEWVEPISK